MNFGPDDFVELCIRYLPGLAFSIIISIAILVVVNLAKRRRPQFAYWSVLKLYATPAPLVCWAIYFTSTVELNYTLTLLGSESSQVAERAYENRFRAEVVTLDKAVSLAVAKHEEPNIRFYASCLVADLLATKDDYVIAQTLNKVDGAPIIETEFFDGNRLTEKFYVPGRAQPQLSVRKIVEQRLQDIHKTGH